MNIKDLDFLIQNYYETLSQLIRISKELNKEKNNEECFLCCCSLAEKIQSIKNDLKRL